MAQSVAPSICSGTIEAEDNINIQIFIPEIQIRKCLTVSLDDQIWDIKRKLQAVLATPMPQAFNYGLFLPPCDGRAGKFLLEDRPIRDYPFHDCVPYLELKYKKRVYKMLNLDEKQLKNLHTKANLKKFMDYVTNKNAEKVEKWCAQGLDANFHDANGETPLTIAAGVDQNRGVIIALIGGGAHIDFRNTEGQTAMHKAAFLSHAENVKTLIELGASPNYRDVIGLTPIYYNMLTNDSKDTITEMLLREAAEIGVTDMHGNHEIHQACKNGLVKHVEHLLYYGAQADVENVNGNTPLHVCAVNSRAECARVLLFRGASHVAVNKQGQTALHVAHIVGTTAVAEVIASHAPGSSVPYRGTPAYSTRRRLSTSTLTRRRSISQSSICSAQQGDYRVPSQSISAAPSPSPSRSTIGSEYGTMRRYAPDHVKSSSASGHETNTPRILVIPRGPKGFGFILRGAKHAEAAMAFEPSLAVPGLQFFEGVDMSGMAMRAGLRPGDFLLQIDGVDVRRASHEEVVKLIQAAGDTITLKVITVDPNAPFPTYATGHDFARQRHHSVNDMDDYYAPGRCASVVHRPTASRRISAAELESLMIRQNTVNSFQPIQQYDQESLSGSQTPKKFTSVADMKRKKQNYSRPTISNGLPRVPCEYECSPAPSNEHPMNSIYGSPMKSYSSSPDIVDYAESQAGSEVGDYSRPFRPTSRPKTPPPPPPPTTVYASSPASTSAPPSKIILPPVVAPAGVPPPPPPPPPPAMNGTTPKTSVASTSGGVPPAPPPPPPPPVQQETAPTGITAAALQAVKLNKTSTAPPKQAERPPIPAASSQPDFQSDLRNALAKRRSKVAVDDDDDDRTMNGSTSTLSALSLRESVRENVKKPIVPSKPQHSPPHSVTVSSFGAKKDSGYTSSRTSLEPSECGESSSNSSSSPNPPHFTLDEETNGHRVALISAQIEDSCYASPSRGTTKIRTLDTMSINSSMSTLSEASSSSGPRRGEPPLPPIDYDDPDSGTGESDGDFAASNSSVFDGKSVNEWTVRDVRCWLASLGLLEEYGSAFTRAKIDGQLLHRFDRALYTSLGVTRIAHRQKMENSIKNFINNNR
uniref:Shn-1 n=1 Tax=Pristionchus pacificus TaxID=54126 RepID=A0A8R1UGW6_PRIPA